MEFAYKLLRRSNFKKKIRYNAQTREYETLYLNDLNQTKEESKEFRKDYFKEHKKLNKNNIITFMHCKLCVDELNNSKSNDDLSMIDPQLTEESHATYARFEVGWTEQGFQVWCIRHNVNVTHINFMGQKVDVDKTRSTV